MANRIIPLYVRIGTGRAFIVDANNVKINPSSYPVIHYSEVADVFLRPLDEDGTPWTLAELDAFGSRIFGIDKDANRATPLWVETTDNFTTNKYDNTIDNPVFSGSGLDDAISAGTHTGTTGATYTIEIDAVDTPDTIRWRKDSGAWTTAVAITSSNTLSDGVKIDFTATTGHTLNDQWMIVSHNAGELQCEADAFTTPYNQGIGTGNTITGIAQWNFSNNSAQDLIIQIPWILKGSIIDPGDSPPGAPDLYVLVSNNPPIESSDPTGGDLRDGLFWWNSTDEMLRVYDATSGKTFNINMTEKP